MQIFVWIKKVLANCNGNKNCMATSKKNTRLENWSYVYMNVDQFRLNSQIHVIGVSEAQNEGNLQGHSVWLHEQTLCSKF